MINTGHAIAGAITGLLVGVTGVGGGALMTPILLIVFGISPTTAVATDLWFATITKIFGAGVHYRSGNVDWQVAKRLWAGSLPVAIAVVLLVSLGHKIAKSHWLSLAVGIIVLVTAVGMMISPWLLGIARNRRLGNPERFLKWQPMLTTLAGAALGCCVALTSVGAGALGSAILLYLYPLRMKPHRLIATDIIHAIPLAFVAGLGYLFAGVVDWNLLGSLLLGSVPGVLIGSSIAQWAKGRWLQVALSLVLFSAGLKVVQTF